MGKLAWSRLVTWTTTADLCNEGSARLSVEAAAAPLRVSVADLAVELGRGGLPVGLMDGAPHLVQEPSALTQGRPGE